MRTEIRATYAEIPNDTRSTAMWRELPKRNLPVWAFGASSRTSGDGRPLAEKGEFPPLGPQRPQERLAEGSRAGPRAARTHP
ncbi:unnamed protein product [Nesidiocoris tenuis]|uniref:Uncharacterized protein n=1 Tax=Nesidiocoris tenuis TaxID=355587 RepID=A0A6H5FUF1_9HEMI|nr:unnamed protein product [Nesidiocoris tenuis]